MPYKDPHKQREYQRECQRRRRAQATGLSNADKPTRTYSLTRLEDLRGVLEKVTGEVMNADLDAGVKGRVIAQLLTAGIKLFEKTDLELRIAALEMGAGVSINQSTRLDRSINK